MADLDRDALEAHLQFLEQIRSDAMGNAIDRYFATEADREAYSQHLAVFNAGGTFRERFMSGGNRSGKSTVGSFECALHATGRYPSWWRGARFEYAPTIWAAGESRDATRDVIQIKLLGPHGQHGTGMIPRETIVETRPRRGVPDAVDTVYVQHVSGGRASIVFKSFGQGREEFQGARVDHCWLDEEPPWSVYEECLLRGMSTNKREPSGKMLVSATPLSGFSDVALHFMQDGRWQETGDRFAISVSWDDAPHLSEQEKSEFMRTIPTHQLDARTRGYPSAGVGAVYQFSEDRLVIPARKVDPWWTTGGGLDVGWNFTACVWLRQNPDTGETWVVDEYKRGGLEPAEHAAVLKLKSQRCLLAIDPASKGRSQLDGRAIFDELRATGLRLKVADNAVEAGIYRVQTMMTEGTLKILDSCPMLLAELRQYSRNEQGKINKRNDHLLDALRYGIFTDGLMRQDRPFSNTPRRVLRAMK